MFTVLHCILSASVAVEMGLPREACLITCRIIWFKIWYFYITFRFMYRPTYIGLRSVITRIFNSMEDLESRGPWTRSCRRLSDSTPHRCFRDRHQLIIFESQILFSFYFDYVFVFSCKWVACWFATWFAIFQSVCNRFPGPIFRVLVWQANDSVLMVVY